LISVNYGRFFQNLITEVICCRREIRKAVISEIVI